MSAPKRDLVPLDPSLHPRGRSIALRLYAAIRTARVHGLSNEAFGEALQKLADEVNALLPHGKNTIELRFQEDIMLLNSVIIRAEHLGMDQLRDLARILLERDVGGLRFTQTLDVDLLGEWIELFETPSPEGEASVRAALEPLWPLGISTLAPKQLSREDLSSTDPSSLVFAVQVYARAMVGFREFVRALNEDRDPFLGRINVVRVLQDAVDVVMARPDHLRTVLTLGERRGDALANLAKAAYPPRHAASLSLWSLLIGAELGLDRTELLDLSTSALISKVGFALLPPAMTDGNGVFTPEQRDQLRVATVRVVEAFIAKSRINNIMMRRVIVLYEHARAFDDEGELLARPHLYARITAIADAYDALRTERPWRPALSSEEALQTLAEEAGRRFDPQLIRVLAGVVGQAQPAASA